MDAFLETDIGEIADRLEHVTSEFAGKTALVTGANGFIGRHFLALFDLLNRERLTALLRVVGVDNVDFAASLDGRFHAPRGFEFHCRDITQPLDFDIAPDFIVHAAGVASPVHYRTRPLETLDVSTLGTRNILELARSCNARMLSFSSSEVYGNPDPEHVPTSENYHGNVSSRGPRACYDEGKRVGETLCDIFHEYHGVNVVVVRPFNVYGPGMGERDYRVLPNFASRLKSASPIEVFGSGEQTRTFCYVTDAMVGFGLALLDGVPGEVYNIGTPVPEISMNDLAALFVTLHDAPASIELRDYPDGYPSNEPLRRCPDIQKAWTSFGYRPQVEIEDGLRRFLGWALEAYTGLGIGAAARERLPVDAAGEVVAVRFGKTEP